MSRRQRRAPATERQGSRDVDCRDEAGERPFQLPTTESIRPWEVRAHLRDAVEGDHEVTDTFQPQQKHPLTGGDDATARGRQWSGPSPAESSRGG